jgi:hypothetical protein
MEEMVVLAEVAEEMVVTVAQLQINRVAQELLDKEIMAVTDSVTDHRIAVAEVAVQVRQVQMPQTVILEQEEMV